MQIEQKPTYATVERDAFKENFA